MGRSRILGSSAVIFLVSCLSTKAILFLGDTEAMCHVPSHEKQWGPTFFGGSPRALNDGLGGIGVILLLDSPTDLRGGSMLDTVVKRRGEYLFLSFPSICNVIWYFSSTFYNQKSTISFWISAKRPARYLDIRASSDSWTQARKDNSWKFFVYSSTL